MSIEAIKLSNLLMKGGVCVLGTGCNAAYVEKVDNVAKWTGPKHESPMVRFAVLRCTDQPNVTK